MPNNLPPFWLLVPVIIGWGLVSPTVLTALGAPNTALVRILVGTVVTMLAAGLVSWVWNHRPGARPTSPTDSRQDELPR